MGTVVPGGTLRTIRVIAGNREYYLPDTQSLEDVRRAALAAVQAGGGLVDFVDRSARQVSLLVSASLPLAFEVVEREEQADVGDEVPFTNLQLDYDF